MYIIKTLLESTEDILRSFATEGISAVPRAAVQFVPDHRWLTRDIRDRRLPYFRHLEASHPGEGVRHRSLLRRANLHANVLQVG